MIKKAYVHMRRALMTFLFPPSTHFIENRNSWRYPGVGSETFNQQQQVQDFRTPYKDSIYNVRFIHKQRLTDSQMVNLTFSPLSPDPIEKTLVDIGLIKKEELDNPKLLGEAKQTYRRLIQDDSDSKELKRANGFPLGDSIGFSELIAMENRQKQLLAKIYKNDSQIYTLKSGNIYADIPQWRHGIIEAQLINQKMFNQIKDKKYPGAKPVKHISQEN